MSTKDIVHAALFAALTAALGLFPPLTLPVIGVPITAQSLGIMLAGSIIGSKRGAIALVLFLVLVAAGLPLLAGGRGGFGVFLGPGGGFLLAWPVGAYVIGLLFERTWNRLSLGLAILYNVLGGVVLIYAAGIPWISFVAKVSLVQAATGAAAFLPGDAVKVVLASLLAVTVKRSYPVIVARA